MSKSKEDLQNIPRSKVIRKNPKRKSGIPHSLPKLRSICNLSIATDKMPIRQGYWKVLIQTPDVYKL